MEPLDISFYSNGLKLSAWLFLPPGAEKPPVVVMAHGFGADKVLGLRPFAERFAAAGLACLVFDYRNFGGSEGQPRNLVSPRRHLADWAAAVSFARSLPQVDGTRLALWGTSFSGGHVLVTAGRDHGVRAVVAQVPFVDGLSTALHYPLLFSLRAVGHGLRDLAASLFGRVHYVPAVGAPEDFALLNKPDCLPGYYSLVPPGVELQNRVAARISLELGFYRPISSAGRIECPVLLVSAEQDSLIPQADVEKTAQKIPRVTRAPFPVGHFEVYTGDWFEKVSKLETGFLAEHLR